MLNNYNVFWDEDHQIYQVRTKTDVYAIEFDSDKKKELFAEMLKLSAKDTNISLAKLTRSLAKKYDDFLIMEILEELKEYGLLTAEYYADIAIKNKDTTPPPVDQKDKKILIVGKGILKTKIEAAFNDIDYSNVDCIEQEELSSKGMDTLNGYDFYVVDGHHWNPVLLKKINKKLIQLSKPWLYIKGVEGAEIKIGPIFLGGELGCYNCLRKRIESNDDLRDYNNNYQNYLAHNNLTGEPDKLPYSNTALQMIASLAVSEVSKYFEQWTLPETIGQYISFNIVTYKTTQHKLLKIPYCQSCKPKLEYNISPWLESVTLS